MIRIHGVRKFNRKIRGHVVEITNSNVAGLEVELTGKNPHIVLRGCKGEITVRTRNVATVFCDRNCDCCLAVPYASAEVIGWNFYGCNNVTPYFSKWFRG